MSSTTTARQPAPGKCRLGSTRMRPRRFPVRPVALSPTVLPVLIAVWLPVLAAIPCHAQEQTPDAAPPAVPPASGQTGQFTPNVIVELTDRVTRLPMTDAIVTAHLGDRTLTASVDDDGNYTFPRLQPGEYQLVIRKVGYQAVERPLILLAGASFHLRIALAPETYAMEPLVVVTTRRDPRLEAIEARRQQGWGVYIDKEDIGRQMVLSNVLIFAAAYIHPSGPPFRQNILFGGNRCAPSLFIDGFHVQGYPIDEFYSLDRMITPEEVELVETYRHPLVPPEFVRGMNDCGAIVVWSRTDLEPSNPPVTLVLKLAAAGAAFFGLTSWFSGMLW